MMSGCASTITACQNNVPIQPPEAWAMSPTSTPIKSSDPKLALQTATENNMRWAEDRKKLESLQKYILLTLKSTEKGK